MCDVCMNESCTEDIGVASIPGVPMSIMWGNRCLRNALGIVVPSFTFDYFYIHVGNGNIDNLIDEVKEYYTWYNKEYIKFTDYIKKFTPEMVKAELEAYEKDLNESFEKEA